MASKIWNEKLFNDYNLRVEAGDLIPHRMEMHILKEEFERWI